MEDETLTAKAEKFKNKGNDEFKLGNYQNAIEYYSQAIGKLNFHKLIICTNINTYKLIFKYIET